MDVLPSEVEGWTTLMLDKILDNFSAADDLRKLTSFSRSMEIALRHAGFRGWLFEVEVAAEDLVEASAHLEQARSVVAPGTDQWERYSEALEMAAEDQEVFLKPDARYEVVKVSMVGSIERGGRA